MAFWFPDSQIEELTWSAITMELLKTAQQRLFFRLRRKNPLSQKLLVAFYRCSIESVLTYSVCGRKKRREEAKIPGTLSV